MVNGSKLKEVNGRFTFDLEDMERKVTNRTKAFLCVIRIIRRELYGQNRNWKESVRFCKAHELFIISDEAHYEFCVSRTAYNVEKDC